MSNFSPFETAFDNRLPTSADNIHTRVAKIEARVLSTEQLIPSSLGGYLPLTGGAIAGNLSVSGTMTIGGPVTVTSYVESGFIFSHFKDATTNVAPASAEVYHETTGTPAVGFGTSLDLSMDDATVKRQVGARFISSWTVAADATRTAQLRIFLPSSGTLTQVIAMSPTTLGFFGQAAVTRPSVPDGSSLATVIDALQALGLFNPV